jgi:hypothetical protein
MNKTIQEVHVHLHPLDREPRDNELCLNTSYKPSPLPLVGGYEGATHLRPQVLYITSSIEPKRGEWGYSSHVGCTLIGDSISTTGMRKIVGATAPLPGIPQITTPFILKYMTFHNEGHPITKAWINLKEQRKSVTTGDGSYSTEIYLTEELDNEEKLHVFIQDKKGNYTLKEVKDLLQKAYMCGYGDRDANLPTFHGLLPSEYLEKIL